MDTERQSKLQENTQGPGLRALVLGASALALALLGLLGRLEAQSDWMLFFLLASLAAIAGGTPLRVPGLRTSISTNEPFVFTALAALGALPACLIATASIVASTLRQPPRRGPIQVAFNLSNLIVSTGTAALAFDALGGRPGLALAALLWPLVGATTVYFVCNTLLVSAAVALDNGSGLLRTWRETALWSAASTYAGALFTVGLLFVLQCVGAAGLALGVPPCWFLANFQRIYRDRQERQQQRIAQVEHQNQELESKVAERTQELQTALERIETANRQLRVTNDSLIAASRAKDEFLANMSHELRTPLNAIIGFSELLGDRGQGQLTPTQREYVSDIHDSGEHLLGLINHILDLSKIEAGRMELNLTGCPVSGILEDMVAMVRPQAAKKDLELTVVSGDGVEEGQLDRGMFRQIVLNLLSNAVKFTPAGGRVTVLSRREGGDLVLEVADTGVGIPSQHLGRIFDAFYQVDGSYSRNYEGTGLGLALVRRMVELHRGTISVSSEVGQGTRFTCRFPESLRSNEPAPQVEAVCTTAGRVVVVVDDNSANRRVLRSVLVASGYSVLEASTGEDALALLEASSADLVLMDIRLPGIDGLEATRRIRANPRTAMVPVVAVTAHVQETDERLARQAGCVGYIPKPIRLASFPREVAGYLQAREVAA